MKSKRNIIGGYFENSAYHEYYNQMYGGGKEELYKHDDIDRPNNKCDEITRWLFTKVIDISNITRNQYEEISKSI